MHIKTGAFDEPTKEIKILLNLGASKSIISKEFTKKEKIIPAQAATWHILAGTFATNSKYYAEFSLPE